MTPFDWVWYFRVRAGFVGFYGTFMQLRFIHFHMDILYWLQRVAHFFSQFGDLSLLLNDWIVQQLHFFPQYLILQLNVVQTLSQFSQFLKTFRMYFCSLNAGCSCSLLKLSLLSRVDLFDELHLLIARGLLEFLLQNLLLSAAVFLL
jgi:hypothetical protein